MVKLESETIYQASCRGLDPALQFFNYFPTPRPGLADAWRCADWIAIRIVITFVENPAIRRSAEQTEWLPVRRMDAYWVEATPVPGSITSLALRAVVNS